MNNYELFSELSVTPAHRRQVFCSLRQLDDQLKLLKARLCDIEVDELQWQLSRGSNTVGMLLAHLAVTEAYWLNVAPSKTTASVDEDSIVGSIVGIRTNDDGIPLPPDGEHPTILGSKQWKDYLGMMEKARTRTHEITASWTDDTLATTFDLEGQMVSNRWVLYHLLEHFCSHFGQILQIRALWHRTQCG